MIRVKTGGHQNAAGGIQLKKAFVIAGSPIFQTADIINFSESFRNLGLTFIRRRSETDTSFSLIVNKTICFKAKNSIRSRPDLPSFRLKSIFPDRLQRKIKPVEMPALYVYFRLRGIDVFRERIKASLVCCLKSTPVLPGIMVSAAPPRA